jgi:hypothetical protein
VRLAAAVLAAGLALAACGGSGSKSSTADGPQVLPATENPIRNDSTVQALKIDSVLVENNVNPATGKDAPDHLEIALRNTGTTTLSGFEVYTTFADPTEKASESYYTKLADSFTIAPGGTRVVHFDATGAPDHYPVNKFSLYSTSKNALDVTVVVSAANAAVQTATTQKDAGGAENPDE